MVVVLERGLISPPMGVKVFVAKGIADDVTMREISIGIMPFWATMLICMIILVVDLDSASVLPNQMIN